MNLEKLMNRLSDMDWAWWPMVSLRPPRDKDIDNRVLLRLTAVFGSLTGALVVLETNLLLLRAAKRPNPWLFLSSFLLGCFMFFVGYKCTFALFWNRRARRLRANATASLARKSPQVS